LLLISKEETIYVIEKYDLVIIFTWERDYIEGSLFHLKNFNLASEGSSSIYNIPLYTETRYFNPTKSDIPYIYIDDEAIKGLSRKNSVAFYCLCELMTLFDIEVNSIKKFSLVWKK